MRLETQLLATRALGWKHIEMRSLDLPGGGPANFHDIPDKAFDAAVDHIKEAGLSVYCFGSAIANWSKKIEDDFEITLAEVSRCIPRMQRLGTKFVRIMSYKPGDTETTIPEEVFWRIGEVTRMFRDAGLQPVHENCMNYGGMSWEHALELLDRCPGLKWVFDTGNPVCNADRSRPQPWPRQDAWEFWEHVRAEVAHIHVKDAIYIPQKNQCDYKYPGEGQGYVRRILKDALMRGYDGAFSIEPHVAAVYHEASKPADDKALYDSYIAYGRQLRKMIGEIKAELA